MLPKVAIVVPVYKQFVDLNEAEKISLQQTFKVLYRHDIYFVTHNEIDVAAYNILPEMKVNIKVAFFDKEYFQSISGYNNLLMSYAFYNAFKKYDYILICQLDVFVFSDMLDYFTRLNYDYIGAPWFENFDLAVEESKIIGVGNGGFSLRKVQSFLFILSIINLFKTPFHLTLESIKNILVNPAAFARLFKHEVIHGQDNYQSYLPWKFIGFEDSYWSRCINEVFRWFKVASIKEAISFAFEVNPHILYDLNNQKLPMAVHAWPKYNFKFWKPIIEERGYSLEGVL